MVSYTRKRRRRVRQQPGTDPAALIRKAMRTMDERTPASSRSDLDRLVMAVIDGIERRAQSVAESRIRSQSQPVPE